VVLHSAIDAESFGFVGAIRSVALFRKSTSYFAKFAALRVAGEWLSIANISQVPFGAIVY